MPQQQAAAERDHRVDSLEALIAAESTAWTAAIRCARASIALHGALPPDASAEPDEPAGAVITAWAQQAYAWSQRAFLDRQCRLELPWSADLLSQGDCPRILADADRHKAEYDSLAYAISTTLLPRPWRPDNPEGKSN